VRVRKDLPAALNGVEALILAVRHKPYLQLRPDEVAKWAGGAIAVVDCFGILGDKDITRYFELGCEVKALGRGHIQRIKEEVSLSRTHPAIEKAVPREVPASLPRHISSNLRDPCQREAASAAFFTRPSTLGRPVNPLCSKW
jgi:hypothetical protein